MQNANSMPCNTQDVHLSLAGLWQHGKGVECRAFRHEDGHKEEACIVSTYKQSQGLGTQQQRNTHIHTRAHALAHSDLRVEGRGKMPEIPPQEPCGRRAGRACELLTAALVRNARRPSAAVIPKRCLFSVASIYPTETSQDRSRALHEKSRRNERGWHALTYARHSFGLLPVDQRCKNSGP